MSAKSNTPPKANKTAAHATPKRGPNGKFLKKGEIVPAEPKPKKDEPKNDTPKTAPFSFCELPLLFCDSLLKHGIIKHHEVCTPDQLDAIIEATRKENDRLRDYIRSAEASEDARLKYHIKEREHLYHRYTAMKERCINAALAGIAIGLTLGIILMLARAVFITH